MGGGGLREAVKQEHVRVRACLRVRTSACVRVSACAFRRRGWAGQQRGGNSTDQLDKVGVGRAGSEQRPPCLAHPTRTGSTAPPRRRRRRLLWAPPAAAAAPQPPYLRRCRPWCGSPRGWRACRWCGSVCTTDRSQRGTARGPVVQGAGRYGGKREGERRTGGCGRGYAGSKCRQHTNTHLHTHTCTHTFGRPYTLPPSPP